MLRQSVLFLTDTQGANMIGTYHPGIGLGTPNIDRLASEGLRFDRAYTCSPVCGPARSAIFTGLYPHSNGVFGNDIAPALDCPNLGERIQGAGVRTGYIGKWHLDGTDYFGNGRCPPGWDPGCWFDGRNYLESLSPDERDLSRRVLGPEDVAAHGITSEFTMAHRIADRAAAFIEKHRGEDFFLVVSIDEPHHPAICPEPFASAFLDFEFPVPNGEDTLAEKPRIQQEWAAHANRTVQGGTLKAPAMFGCNSYSDSQVGRVLDAIDAHAPGALVIYTADHGDMLGSHRLWSKGPAMYEEAVRIPFIVRWPGCAPSGATTAGLASHIDIAPTLLEFFGVAVPPLLQGRSLLPQIKDPLARVNEFAFIEFNRFEVDHDGFGAFAPIRCILDGERKLAINLLDTDEYYHLDDDPLELDNRIARPDPRREALLGELIAWQNRTRDPLRGPHWRRRPWFGNANARSWGGPTRPRPFDEPWQPRTLNYVTGREIDRLEYPKD